MTGPEFRAIRLQLGLGVVAFGYALGYSGSPNTVSVLMRRYEDGRAGDRKIPPAVSRLAVMFKRYGVPAEWIDVSPSLDPPPRHARNPFAVRR